MDLYIFGIKQEFLKSEKSAKRNYNVEMNNIHFIKYSKYYYVCNYYVMDKYVTSLSIMNIYCRQSLLHQNTTFIKNAYFSI